MKPTEIDRYIDRERNEARERSIPRSDVGMGSTLHINFRRTSEPRVVVGGCSFSPNHLSLTGAPPP